MLEHDLRDLGRGIKRGVALRLVVVALIAAAAWLALEGR